MRLHIMAARRRRSCGQTAQGKEGLIAGSASEESMA